jgi:hypothetical protein
VSDLVAEVLGAGSRIELHLYADSLRPRDDLQLWAEVDAVADRRLRRRMVLSFRGEPQADLRALVRQYRGTGWAVRAYHQAFEGHPMEYLLADREQAWVGGGNQSSKQLNRHVVDRPTIDGLVSHFRHVWALAVPAESDLLWTASGLSEARLSDRWDEILEELHARPENLYLLEPRRFEELVAELLSRRGYRVTLTPASRDGGKDLLLASPTDVGDFLFLVECKRYAPNHRVEVDLVRQLYGVVEAERATAGILVTTSRFTGGARQFQGSVGARLALRDYESLRDWISSARRPAR